jgi:Flp pilus assembly protein TadD/TolB-like protein
LLRWFTIVSATLLLTLSAAAQASMGSQTLLVLPFENSSKVPGLEWIGESFPEVLGERMQSAGVYVVPRQDRLYAFDRAAIPGNLRPSHATLFRVGEELDVDYLVLGRYSFDGQTFKADAQLLDVKRLRLSDPLTEAGPLGSLFSIEAALAWDLLRKLDPNYPASRADFLAGAPPAPRDAFEDYIRGITAASRTEKVRKLREALRVSPAYTPAMMQLGSTYFSAHDYEAAAGWFARVPQPDPAGGEASFYAGLSWYFLGDFEKAESAFSYLASRFPLTEVYNNLGAAEARRGKSQKALEHFRKSVQADENDPDYRFNLGLALYRAGDLAEAQEQWREVLKLRPGDNEARNLLDTAGGKPDAIRARLPLERIKRNYDETSFRQLELEIAKATEARLANSDPHTHAAYHVEHGSELLRQGFSAEAGKQFREAVTLEPNNAAAHAGLAAALQAGGDKDGAWREASEALTLQPSVAAYLLLARLDLEENKPEAAQANVAHALELDPNSTEAAALKRTIAEKLAEKGQLP